MYSVSITWAGKKLMLVAYKTDDQTYLSSAAPNSIQSNAFSPNVKNSYFNFNRVFFGSRNLYKYLKYQKRIIDWNQSQSNELNRKYGNTIWGKLHKE